MIQRFLTTASRTFVETVLPAACPACRGPLGDHSGGVCASCWDEAVGTGGGHQIRPYRHLDSVTAVGSYEGRLRQIIRCLKFSDLPGLAAPLGERLAERLAPLAEGIDLVVPVPLHRWRRWRRGYNQAELIAARVARGLGRPLAPEALRRRRATASQRGRSRSERAANVRGAFCAPGLLLEGTNVLLVDDVVTTGATFTECARMIRAAGARAVHAGTIARTLTRTDT